MKNINADYIWDYPEYEELIEDILITILNKEKYISIIEDDFYSLFSLKNTNEKRAEKVKALIFKLTKKHSDNEKLLLLLVEVVYSTYSDWFLDYFREFLMLIKDIEIIKQISFGRISSTTGSWVPVYQKKIEFYQDIERMINTVPNILDYSENIEYFEQKIRCNKREIEREQKRDFMKEFY